MAGVPVAAVDEVGIDPVRVVMVDTHQVEAELRHSMRMADDTLAGSREDGAGDQVAAPEPHGGPIAADELVAVGSDSATAAGGPIIPVQEAEIDRCGVPGQRVADPPGRIGLRIALGGKSIRVKERQDHDTGQEYSDFPSQIHDDSTPSARETIDEHIGIPFAPSDHTHYRPVKEPAMSPPHSVDRRPCLLIYPLDAPAVVLIPGFR